MRHFWRITRLLMTAMALVSAAVAPAFSPAYGMALLLMALSGVIAVYGQLKTAIVNLALTSVTVMLGPWSLSAFHSVFSLLLFLLPVLIGFGGVLFGIHTLQRGTSGRQPLS